jgi:hypothetical protein
VVVPGVYPMLGATEAEAFARKAELDDQLDLEHLKSRLAEPRISRIGSLPAQCQRE